MNRKLRSATFVSSSASRRRLWALLPGTMLSQAFSRLYVSSKRLPSWTAITFIASAVWCCKCARRPSRAGRASASSRRRSGRCTSSSVSASPSCRTVAFAESSTSISSGRVSGDDVVHDRHALVEEVPAAGLEVATHPVVRDALPLQARDELAGNRRSRSCSRCANVWLGGSFIVSTLTTPVADDRGGRGGSRRPSPRRSSPGACRT